VRRLYAVGEVACTGVHGANRLASNSLLEALVFADHAAADTLDLLRREGAAGAPAAPEAWLQANDPARQAVEVSPEFVAQMRLLVQTLMWTHVGIVRSDHRLKQALREVEILRAAVDNLFASSRVTVELLELRNITETAWLIIACALQRKESRGLHYNVDYPARDDAHYQRDTILAPMS
ncbi:MAG TPA: FAD-binding protein, partial [Armatimonadota bacterium]|nr:FAD-binding protein [Armatimonadota bacterium]